MLLGEDFGGRHQRHLVAGLDGLQGGQGSDYRLAPRPTSPLHQPQHGLGLGQVMGDLAADALLGTGGGEAEVVQIHLRQPASGRQGDRTLGAQGFAQALQGQLVGQQFFEDQPFLGPVAAPRPTLPGPHPAAVGAR